MYMYIYIYICICMLLSWYARWRAPPVDVFDGSRGLCVCVCIIIIVVLLLVVVVLVRLLFYYCYYSCYYYDYTRSPLEDSRLFGPNPWKILAATNENDISEQPSPWRKIF